jgi:hypothetical protein
MVLIVLRDLPTSGRSAGPYRGSKFGGSSFPNLGIPTCLIQHHLIARSSSILGSSLINANLRSVRLQIRSYKEPEKNRTSTLYDGLQWYKASQTARCIILSLGLPKHQGDQSTLSPPYLHKPHKHKRSPLPSWPSHAYSSP